jgi:hypothetical protein
MHDELGAAEPFESVEASFRAYLKDRPYLADSPLAASALAIAKSMDRKTTSLLAGEFRDTLAVLDAVEPPQQGELSQLEQIRARRSERRGA